MTETLFAYGTLNDPAKQQELFGRRIEGAVDALDGYETTVIDQEGDRYLVAVPSRNGHIEGAVLELTTQDLDAADVWEGEAYARIECMLRSGTVAWVYIKKETK